MSCDNCHTELSTVVQCGSCGYVLEFNRLFNINKEEAKILYKFLSKEFITREPEDEYEVLMKIIRGLNEFIGDE